MVYIILGGGFEEMEALAPCDILRRGGVEVKLAGVGGRTVCGGQGVSVNADIEAADIDLESAELVVIPGGTGGVKSIEGSADTMKLIKDAAMRGVPLASICLGPRVLSRLGLLDGRDITCYPGTESQMTGARSFTGTAVAESGGLITGRGPGACIDFGLALLASLRGDKAAEAVKNAMHY